MLKKLLGDENKALLKTTAPIVKKINDLEPAMVKLSDAELTAKTQEFRDRLAKGETVDSLLPEAFAVVREASKRETGLRHYDVQLIGGILLHKKTIAEMKTGEGKTLVATLPTYLHGLTGKGIHVVTVNDYLARRDAVWVGQIHARLGLTIGIVNTDGSYLYDTSTRAEAHDEERDETAEYKISYDFLKPCTRKEAYAADVVYGTNSEFGFDYLRDNLEFNPANLRQREMYFAIVDEVDSILIDEARTPLIISAATRDSEDLYRTFADIAAKLNEGEDYAVDEKYKSIALTDKGIESAEKELGIDNIYTEKGIKYVHHLETAVKAKALFLREKDYVIKNSAIIIVDESTGRMQPGRRWSDGLHQAVEAKEGIAIQAESRTIASITYQNYFRMYEQLSGMTGTAETSKEEFFKVYGLDVAVIPTNKPIARLDQVDLIFQTEQGKFKAISKKVKELQEKGQPVLIGTVSVEKSEMLSAFLAKQGIKHQILNAKNHENEGAIIADAGRKFAVTVATNMAGRGVDIKLGGIGAKSADYEEIKSLGGLYVIGTERHEARRIDNQLRGRSGRQGDPGETQFYVSMEDSLMRVFASDMVTKMMGTMGLAEDEPITAKMISKSLEHAQTRIEGFNFDSRKHILSYDDVLNIQRTAIYKKRRIVLAGAQDELEMLIADLVIRDEKFKAQAEEKRTRMGDKVFFDIFRKVYLEVINRLWMEHLEAMDYVRSSVRLRSYGQRDPLVEYKREGMMLFKQLTTDIENHVMDTIERINLDELDRIRERAQQQAAETEQAIDAAKKAQSQEQSGEGQLSRAQRRKNK